jgi:hypothetical protein
MGASLANLDQALREDYQPGVREELNNANVLLAQVEKNERDVEGRRAVLSLHVTRNSGVGARLEGGIKPTAGNQGYAEERVPLKTNMAVVTFTQEVILQTKTDKGSFVRAVDSELTRAKDDLKRDVNRQLWGTTDGVIATAGTTTASTTVQLAAATPLSAMRELEVGMYIDLGTVAAPQTVASNRQITAVDSVNKTITISGAAVTTTSSHKVFRTGLNATSSANNVELTGVQSIVATSGTLFNVDPATYPVWATPTASFNTSGGSISENAVTKVQDNIAIASGQEADLIISSYGVRRAYATLLTTNKRFVNTVDLKGGFKGLDVSNGGSPTALVVDRDCPDGTMWLLNTSHLFEYQASDWEFQNDDGSILARQTGAGSSLSYEGTIYKRHEFTTDMRNAHGALTGLTEA